MGYLNFEQETLGTDYMPVRWLMLLKKRVFFCALRRFSSA
jgi:hypothetical protein